MNRIEVYSNWCYYDRLDGVDLKTGDVLHLRWPDGSSTVEHISVSQDWGGGIHSKTAQVRISVRGTEAYVPIRGWLAERVPEAKMDGYIECEDIGAIEAAAIDECLGKEAREAAESVERLRRLRSRVGR